MWIILDIIPVCLMLYYIISGTHRGLIASLGKFAVTLCAVIVTFYFTGPVAAFFRTTVIYDTLTSRVEKKVTDYIDDMNNEAELRRLLDTAPREIVNLFDSFGVSTEDVTGVFDDVISSGKQKTANAVCDYVVTPAAVNLSKAAAGIVLYFGTVIAAKLLLLLIGLIFRIPALDEVNHFGGFVFGIVAGFVVCCLFCTAVGFALPYLGSLGIALNAETAKTAVIYSFFAKINPLSFLL